MREDLIECYAENSICCHNSHCFNSVPFKAKMSCKHGYIGHANMLNLFRKISWLSFTQSRMNDCILIWRVVIHILLLPTHVSLRLAPGCFAFTLVILLHLVEDMVPKRQLETALSGLVESDISQASLGTSSVRGCYQDYD